MPIVVSALGIDNGYDSVRSSPILKVISNTGATVLSVVHLFCTRLDVVNA